MKKKKKKENVKVLDATPYKHLERRIRNLTSENQLLNAERLRLEQELHDLRNEIDRLREPPLVGAVIIDFLDEFKKRALIMSTTGAVFAVNVSLRTKNKKLVPGMFVLLNQRTFAIIEVLNIDSKDIAAIDQFYYGGIYTKLNDLLEKLGKLLLKKCINE